MKGRLSNRGFTLIELLVVIAIIAILAVVVVLTLNPAELLRQSRDANRISDMATLTSALNLYTADQGGSPAFNLGSALNTAISVPDPTATSTNACPSLGLSAWNASSGQQWICSASTTYRTVTGGGWLPVNLSGLSSGSPIGNLPVDPTNQTSSGLFYAYNTNGNQFVVTADLESQKYKSNYAQNPEVNYFPEVITGGNAGISSLYNSSGLVGYWPLNEGSGSSTIDGSGNGNAGTWGGTPAGANGTYYTSNAKVGNYAGYFSGASNNYVTVGSSAAALKPSNITLAFWAEEPGAVTPQAAWIGDFAGWPPAGYSLAVDVGSGSTFYTDWNVGEGVNLYTVHQSGLSTGKWYFLAGTFDGTTLKYYVNGNLAGSATGTLAYGSSNFVIGQNNAPNTPLVFDDVRLYNRALSATEVTALYDAEK